MANIDWVKVAKVYLREANAYDAFMKNARESFGYDVDLEWLVSRDEAEFFEGAFVWADTDEGHEYWSRMCSAWRAMYKAING